MLNFYPGPSRVNSKIPRYMLDAYREGVVSINHRSPDFIEISKSCQKQLRKKLNIPADYSIFYTSSATETWEIIAQSLIQKSSYHVFNGDFGEKWFAYTQKLHPKSTGYEFSYDHALKLDEINVPSQAEVICLTQNETSNATQIPDSFIGEIRRKYTNRLIAVDVTSSLAGINLSLKNADIWFASVQKCFGLPAGLGLMICSPEAIEYAKKVGNRQHYNSLSAMVEKMKDYQTTHTPNVLNIYLLQQVMRAAPKIGVTHDKTLKRFKNWVAFLSSFSSFQLLNSHPEIQSYTVLAIKGDEKLIGNIHQRARQAGIILGKGYGKFKENTVRIANFPAIKEREIKICQKFFKRGFE
ncbi:aminotransferase class V-fold PLP-dependent enzyme [Fulvivirgaceae bacterium BMA12]|uniref:Aminotransferase class V-fold PLP-dependent enzyme n=1 Tax=Agaribacillus aureus TaxID=3051825 RepID=A0ABT8L4X3_9BACT|nr:aminotransferase class V-fold PLP-dependent enzyme [Fulvivirgaceae bacterium BMA12]